MPTILFADEALIVVDKPAGLLSQPGRGPDKQDSVITRVLCSFADAVIVHRLDEPTSGLMVIARGLDANRALGRAFSERRVEKRYQAIVNGMVAADEGTIDVPLSADWPNRPRQKIDHDHGKPAVTHYQVRARDAGAGCSHVDLTPVTGRTHQLRMHMMALGHTILGDSLYANPEVLERAPRLLLHACQLSFDHPQTGARMAFSSPTPFLTGATRSPSPGNDFTNPIT